MLTTSERHIEAYVPEAFVWEADTYRAALPGTAVSLEYLDVYAGGEVWFKDVNGQFADENGLRRAKALGRPVCAEQDKVLVCVAELAVTTDTGKEQWAAATGTEYGLSGGYVIVRGTPAERASHVDLITAVLHGWRLVGSKAAPVGTQAEAEGRVGAYDDTDADGLVAELDACPAAAEDFDAWKDEDGCPEGTQDADEEVACRAGSLDACITVATRRRREGRPASEYDEIEALACAAGSGLLCLPPLIEAYDSGNLDTAPFEALCDEEWGEACRFIDDIDSGVRSIPLVQQPAKRPGPCRVAFYDEYANYHGTNFVTVRWDANGRKLGQTDEVGDTTYTYGADGRRAREVFVEFGGATLTSNTTYDTSGRVLHVEQRQGEGPVSGTTYAYDADGRLVSTTSSGQDEPWVVERTWLDDLHYREVSPYGVDEVWLDAAGVEVHTTSRGKEDALIEEWITTIDPATGARRRENRDRRGASVAIEVSRYDDAGNLLQTRRESNMGSLQYEARYDYACWAP